MGAEDGAGSPPLAGEGLAASWLPSSGPVVQLGLGRPFILQFTVLRVSENALFGIFTPQKICSNISCSCVEASETGPKHKQNIGILYLFSTTLKTQDLIIHGS